MHPPIVDTSRPHVQVLSVSEARNHGDKLAAPIAGQATCAWLSKFCLSFSRTSVLSRLTCLRSVVTTLTSRVRPSNSLVPQLNAKVAARLQRSQQRYRTHDSPRGEANPYFSNLCRSPGNPFPPSIAEASPCSTSGRASNPACSGPSQRPPNYTKAARTCVRETAAAVWRAKAPD